MEDGPVTTSEWLDNDQVAERLHVPSGTVRKWRAEKTGPPARKFGRHVRYHIDDVDQWAQEQETS